MIIDLNKQKNTIILLFFYSLSILIALLTFQDFGIHIEEKFHRLNGHYWLNYISKIFGFTEIQNITEIKINQISDYTLSSVSTYNKYGILLDLPAALFEILFKIENVRDVYYLKHILSFFIFLLSSFFFFKVLLIRYRNFYLSFLGLVLYVTTPRILGDSFLYKDVLFLCLNTQGGPGSKPALLEDEQIQWALHELRKNQQVRWTIVFMHQPLWLMEEGILIRKNGNKELRRTDTGWPRVAKELKKRNHTVYAGHVHHYGKYLRNKTSFYTLGTTGGGSKLRGKAFGEFDHACWITMTDEGPRMANLLIDGIMKDDVTRESHQVFWRSLVFEEYFQKGSVLDGKELTLIIKNPFEFKIGGRLSWIQPAHKNVEVDPMSSNVSLLPGKEKILKFKLQEIGESKKRGFKSLPKLEVRFKSEDNSFDLEMLMDIPIEK